MLKPCTKPELWIILGIPAIFIFGTALHFLFNRLKGFAPAGIFSAVNESVWEHMKLAVLPTISWWLFYFVFCGKKYALDINVWLTSATLSLVVCLLLIPMLFYFYTQAFGTEIVWVDILIFAVSVAVGQLPGLHYFRYGEGVSFIFCTAVLSLTVILFAVFTFFPPKLPLFEDPTNGTYGIQR